MLGITGVSMGLAEKIIIDIYLESLYFWEAATYKRLG